MTKQNIIDLLSKIKYPGFSKDIISFGMLKEILISEESITINLSQSTNDQNILDQIKSDILDKVKSINLSNKEIEIIMSPSESLNKNNIDVQRNKNIKNIIAISSGKGGVGKSTIAINIASELSKSHKVGLLDLDIYGPSLPTLIGDKQIPKVVENNLLIPINKFNMKFMSFGFLNSKNDPAIWRGPMVSKLTHQFFDNVDWGELDYLILDLPPGTGDIQLTLVQKIALTGAIIITTPQDLAHKDVIKGSDMFSKVNTPVLGVIENMSYYNLKGKINGFEKGSMSLDIDRIDKNIDIDSNGCFNLDIEIFKGKSGEKESSRLDIPLLGAIPLDPELSLLSDMGKPYVFQNEDSPVSNIFKNISKKITEIVKTNKE
jgi:ATP-binding protein involved in chromosome partitioning